MFYDYKNSASWFKDTKPNLKMDFPNLPYIFDDAYKIRISESIAILTYLPKRAKKLDLLGKNFQDEMKVEELKLLLEDL